MMKHYKRLLYAFVVCFLAAGSAFAQTITGKVVDTSNQPMPGVNVIKKGTASGTTTDATGAFTLEANDDDVLVFSFIGYASQEIRVGSQTNITVNLAEDVLALNEVVVVGYGTQRKSDLTGSVASVSGAKLAQSMVGNVDQAFQGRIAGVQVTQNSGAPGGATTVTIRGVSTLGNNQPLYVIDGVPFVGTGTGVRGLTDGGNGQTSLNPLSLINPADIETIDVLKDASAAAIYGSRASNGVIIITTKRGKLGQSKISYNGYYGVQSLREKQDMMNLAQYADYRKTVATERGEVVDNHYLDPSLLGAGTDWQNEVFREAAQQSHSVSVTGGRDKTTYAVMGGFFKQDGIAIKSDLKRFNTRVNIDTEVNDWFSMGARVSYSNSFSNLVNDGSGDGIFAQALSVQPDVPVRDANGEFAGPPQNTNSAEVKYNPVAITMLRTNTLAQQRLTGNFFGVVQVLKDLSFRTEISLDNNHTQNINFNPTYKWGPLVNSESILQDQRGTGFGWVWTNYFTYKKTFAKDHNVTFLFGAEALKGTWQSGFVIKKNLATNDLPVLSQGDNVGQITGGDKMANTLSSYIGRLNYAFSDRYLATFTLRNDGSSRFGPNNKRGYFPAASVAWHASNEEFLKGNSVLTDLKFRVGYGEVGNQEIDNYAYGSSLVTVVSPFGTTYRLNRLPNPDVKWEAGTQANIGIDLSLFQGRVDLTLDLFKRGTRDFLMPLPIPLYLGGAAGGGVFAINAPIVNLGKMENKGIDISLNTHNVRRGSFSWDTDFIFSLFRNKITKLDDSNVINNNVYLYGVFNTPTRSMVGLPIGQFYGYVTDGLFQNEEEIRNHATQVLEPGTETETRPNGENKVDRTEGVWIGDIKFKDLNGDGVINAQDQTFIGNPNPKFTFGVTNTFSYKSFTLGVFVTGSYGGKIFNALRFRTEGMLNQSNNQLATVAGRAKIEPNEAGGDIDDISAVHNANPDATIPRFTSTDPNGNQRLASDRWIEDGSYLRIQNISLGYTLPTAWITRAKLSRVRIYADARNAIVFTKYSGYDPEIGANNQNLLAQSIDSGRYPTPKMFTIGIDLEF